MAGDILEHQHRDQVIRYHLRRTRRKSIGVYVFPDGRVEVRIPLRARQARAEAYVAQMSDWIVQQLARCSSEGPQRPVRYESGTEHYYAGRLYTLHVELGSPQRVELSGDQLRLYCLDPSDIQRVERVLYQWYRQQAERHLRDRMATWWQVMRVDLPHSTAPDLRFRRMKRRWGSCSQRNSISLNVELIRYDPRCWDLVVVHELCHLKVFHHGQAFYQLMTRYLPDWRARQQQLEGMDRRKSVD